MLLQTSKLKFKVVDIFYILMMILPIVCGIVLQVLTEPPSTEITITGASPKGSFPFPQNQTYENAVSEQLPFEPNLRSFL